MQFRYNLGMNRNSSYFKHPTDSQMFNPNVWNLWTPKRTPLIINNILRIEQTRYFAKRLKRKQFKNLLIERKREKGEEVEPPKVFKDGAFLWRKGYPSLLQIKNKQSPNIPRISCKELKELLDSKQNVAIVDLRDSDVGEPMIPNSGRIPIARTKLEKPLFKKDNEKTMTPEQQILSIKETLKLGEEQFQKKFKFNRPRKDQLVVFYSSTGIRADTITEASSQIGFNAKSLLGGVRMWNKYYGSDTGLPIPLIADEKRKKIRKSTGGSRYTAPKPKPQQVVPEKTVETSKNKRNKNKRDKSQSNTSTIKLETF